MNLGAKVVKHRHIIFIVSLLLLIPSLIGYKTTRINYDMLTYLPSTMDTMKGQNVLMKEFGKGGFSIVVLENMKSDDVTQLKADYSRINGVEEVLNLEDVLDPTVPKSMLPDQVAQNLSNKDASMMVVFFSNLRTGRGQVCYSSCFAIATRNDAAPRFIYSTGIIHGEHWHGYFI